MSPLQRSKVLIVDDTEDNITLLQMILEDQYDLCEARNGRECIEVAKKEQPDTILLDVNMPEMNGYDACRELRKDPDTALIPVIFVSALDLPEQRLEGFEAGGDEYIVKPVDADQLIEKISKILTIREENKKLRRSADDAVSTALEAMTASSELGQLIQFMKKTAECHSAEQLADAVKKVSASYGLSVAVMAREPHRVLYFGCEPDSTEARAINKCSEIQKIYDFGSRTVFSEPAFSILVKNMPLDEPERYGRLKDNVAVLCSIANNRMSTLHIEDELASRRTALITNLIHVSEAQLEKTHEKVSKYDKDIQIIMADMINQLEEKLLFLGLEDDQEAALMKLASDTTDRLESIGGFAKEIESSLGEVLDGLYKLLSE